MLASFSCTSFLNLLYSLWEWRNLMKILTEGKPLKLILQFALPLLVGRIFQLFYSLVDTRIVGEILGEIALAAVGSTSTLSDLLLSLLLGVTDGFGIVIATFFGAKDEKNMKKAIGSAVIFALSVAILVSILSLLFLAPILDFLNISADLRPIAESYIRIILLGLVTATCYNICASILRAVGDSVTPLIFLIFSTIVNIVLDYTFILCFHMGVAGAALATVISQAISALLCFFYMKHKYPELNLTREEFIPDKHICRPLISTGCSMAFMSAFVQFGTFSLQTSINTFGTNTIVAHSAARKISMLFMMPWGALGSTLATFCGQNMGAKKYDRIKIGIRDTILFTWGWCLVVILTAFTLSPFLIQLITATNEPEIINTASLYLKVNTLFYFVPTVICLLRSSMQGFGDSKTPVFSSSLELITKVVVAFVLAPLIGYWGIIISEPVAWIIMVIPLIINTLRNPIWK